jgi:hypothetical protein
MRNEGAGLIVAGAMLAFSSILPARSNQPQAAGTQTAVAAAAHDLSGVWTSRPPASARAYINSTFSKDEPAMTPWAEVRYKATKPSNGPRTYPLEETNDPVLKSCSPPGVPRIYLQPFPMQIVQTAKELIMLYEYDHIVRHIYTDGRKHPDDATPTYMGHSIGNWEGDVFVVDTTGFNDKTWLDRTGHPHSDALHVIERFRRVDRDMMQIDITMDDPKALAKPWITQLSYQLKPDWEIAELACTDNAEFLGFEK